MQPKVSVIVPVYNAQEHLRQCLDSIIHQSLREFEIICVDDGSSDGSPEILEEYRQKDERFSYVRQENAGAGAARNAGLLRASGEYLSFLDSDDFFEPEMLEKSYERAKAAQAQILVFRSDQYREDLDEYVQVKWTLRQKALPPYRPMNHRSFTDNVFKVFVGWAWDKLFLREFVLAHDLRYQELRTTNDMLFVFTALVLADRIEICDEVLVHQRRNNPASLSNTREKSWWCFHEALLALRANLEKYGLYHELEQDYINYALHFSLWNYNTLTGEKKDVLLKTLQEEWFEEFGITGKPASYFYNKEEYRGYERLTKNIG